MGNCAKCGGAYELHPGHRVRSIINYIGCSPAEFAGRIGADPEEIDALIKGEIGLSEDVAEKLAEMQGVNISYWMNLQSAYESAVLKDAAARK